MKHISLCIALITGLFSIGIAQNSVELEKRNGFKDIKLGSMVDSVKGVAFVKEITNKDGQVSKIYLVDSPEYKKIGEVTVNNLELTAYNGLIYIIRVTTDKDLRLMKGMEMALGKAEWDVRNDQYLWKAEKLSLTFKSVDKNSIELTYTSYPILQQMKTDLKKKIEEIADDF
jgi:hypothetical protein